MNVSKYVKEDEPSAIALIEESGNLLDTPSNFFAVKSGRSRTAMSDNERLAATLSRKYTVLAREDEQVVGLASMDNDGNIGLLIVDENGNKEKIASALLRALERRAEKRELEHLTALSTSESEDILLKRGFVSYDNNDSADGESFMVKEIVAKNKDGFSADKVQKLRLDSTKAVTVEGKSSIFPYVLLFIGCLFAILLIVLSIVNYRDTAPDEAVKKLLPFIIVAGGIFIASVVWFILYTVKKINFKKEILSMEITNGMIVSDISTLKSGRRRRNGRIEYAFHEVSFTYVYYDGDMKQHSEQFKHKYQNSAPYFYKGQEVVVAYSKEKSYLLKKFTLADSAESLLNTQKAISKSILTEEDIDSSPVTNINPNDYMPLQAQQKYVFFPLYIFLVWCVVAVAIVVFNYSVSKQTGKSIWDVSLPFALFAVFATVILWTVCIISALPLLRAHINYKKLRQKGVKFTQGKLICQDKTYGSSNKNTFLCVYKTANGEKKQIKIPRFFAQDKVKKDDTNVIVAYDETVAVALIPKNNGIIF